MREYKLKEEKSYITYLDMNNLYGHAMSQEVPTGVFKWTAKHADPNDYPLRE